MNSRERVMRAVKYDNPDRMPIEIMGSATGLHEHGEKLRDLFIELGSDYGDISGVEVRHPDPSEVTEDGVYRAYKTDEWGITWEHNIYGAWGHPYKRPLDDLSNLDGFVPPDPPEMSGPEFEQAKRDAAIHRETWYHRGGAGNIFEIMHSMRKFEDVLMDIYDDTPEINRLADMLFDLRGKQVEYALAMDADEVGFGDDYGTQEALILSLPVWRRFFKPRYEEIMRPIREAGKNIHFHSCGYIQPLLPDLAELGVTGIWPQLPVYDIAELRAECRDLGMAVALHPDRSHLMTNGTPDDVRAEIKRLRGVFDKPEGGAWWFIEIDTGFPWENIVALCEAVRG